MGMSIVAFVVIFSNGFIDALPDCFIMLYISDLLEDCWHVSLISSQESFILFRLNFCFSSYDQKNPKFLLMASQRKCYLTYEGTSLAPIPTDQSVWALCDMVKDSFFGCSW